MIVNSDDFRYKFVDVHQLRAGSSMSDRCKVAYREI